MSRPNQCRKTVVADLNPQLAVSAGLVAATGFVPLAKAEMRAHIQRSEEFAKTLTLTELARRKSYAKRSPPVSGE